MAYVALTQADLVAGKPAKALSFALRAAENFENHEDRLLALAALNGVPLGGSPGAAYENTSYAAVVFPIYQLIDGTELGGLTFELRFMGQVTAADTCYVELYDRTAAAAVLSSEIAFTNTVLALVVSGPFALAEAEHEYEVRVKATTGGAAAPFVAYGFELKLVA